MLYSLQGRALVRPGEMRQSLNVETGHLYHFRDLGR